MPVNGVRLFRLFGITVYLHWLWLPVALWGMSRVRGEYQSIGYAALEYLGLFGIVLMHEFGHALACRSVGGAAERIVLWPLGGVAYVSPPPRPGAVLWAIAAGPLVNVALLAPLWFLAANPPAGDWGELVYRLAWINTGLLVFNLLPVYPLDGGQILQALMWFVIGRSRSLFVSAVIGMIGAAGLGVVAVKLSSFWVGIMAAFVASRAWAGWQHAKAIRDEGEAEPRRFAPQFRRRPDFACPACGNHPPVGPFWACGRCGVRLDKFDYPYGCPSCGQPDAEVPCPDCRARPPYPAWRRTTTTASPYALPDPGELVDG